MLDTDRLTLRPMTADDATPLLGVFGDPLVMASFGVAPFDREQMRRWVERNLAHQREHGYGLWVVVLRETGQVIGDCGLEWQSIDGEPVAELGYDLRSDHWDQGYATEAARAVRDHAFDHLGIDRLVSMIRVGNMASRRVAEKVGMHLMAEVRQGDRSYWQYRIDRLAWDARASDRPATPAAPG